MHTTTIDSPASVVTADRIDDLALALRVAGIHLAPNDRIVIDAYSGGEQSIRIYGSSPADALAFYSALDTARRAFEALVSVLRSQRADVAIYALFNVAEDDAMVYLSILNAPRGERPTPQHASVTWK